MNFWERLNTIRIENRSIKKMNRILYWSICSFIMIPIIRIIRTQHFKLNAPLQFLQGTLPNFFAATAICALMFSYNKVIFNKDEKVYKKLWFASIFTFVCLTLWEVIEKFLGSPIDIYDIFMSALGCLLTCIFISNIIKVKR